MADANAPTEARLPPTTLTYLLQEHKIPFETLYERHGAASTCAKLLLGVVPNTGKYYEIWPPANKMYYIMVPCFLNLPAYLFGFGGPKDLVSLALYSSSLAAGCPYCTSHTCTFSVRRGVDTNKLGVETLAKRASGETAALYTPAENAVIDVAEHLARFPCKLTDAHRRALLESVNNDKATAESIVLGATMMGYLNKGMDALGMPLEVTTYRETRDILGVSWSPGLSGQLVDPAVDSPEAKPPTDGISTYWNTLLSGPSAMSFESKALAGIPTDAADATAFLAERYGFDFPVIKSMQHNRAMVAVTAMIHEGFNPSTSVIGTKAKLAVAQIFATITESKPAQEAITGMATHYKIDQVFLNKAAAFARAPEPIAAAETSFPAADDAKLQALLIVAHAASWSPARISEEIIRLCERAEPEPAALVEVVAVVSVLQMLHRISMWYRSDDE